MKGDAMLSWKRTYSLGLILFMLASAVIVFTGTNAEPTRASAPTLTNASVSPSTGYTDTLFNFTVWYTDTDNDTPLSVSVVIGSTSFNMTENRTMNWNYSTGVEFYYTSYLAAGIHYYYYNTLNVLREGARDPLNGTKTISVRSKVTGPQLYNGTYLPARPDNSTGVNFSVMYKHSNGTAPMYVNLYIYDVPNSQYLTYNMTGSGSNFSSGVAYAKSLLFDTGYYEYRFTTRTSKNDVVNLPPQGMLTLYVSSSGPQNSDPDLSGAGFSPATPSTGQNMTFWVMYTDADDDAPLRVLLTYHPSDHPANYTVVNVTIGSGNVTRGVNCSAMINAPSNGSYYYFFTGWDIHGARSTSSTNMFVVGNGSSPPPRYPYLSSGGHSPQDPTSNDTVTFSVIYFDPNGQVTPNSVRLNLPTYGTGDPIMMTKGHGNITTGIKYYTKLELAASRHCYSFTAYMSNYTIQFPEESLLTLTVSNGTVVPPPQDSPPQLSSGSHSPTSPIEGHNVTFTVTYADRDGDAPLFVNLVIGQPWIDTPTMNTYNMTVTGTNYNTGVTASITLRLVTTFESRFGYSFSTYSNGSHARLPPGSWYNLTLTPTTPGNHSPVLSSGSYSPSRPTASSNITFTVIYSDRDGDAPLHVKLFINPIQSSQAYTSYNMTWSGSSYLYGVTASVTIKLSAGNYSYYFQTASGNWTTRLPSSGISTISVAAPGLPQQNRAPTLTNLMVLPTSQVANSTVYFTITYTDADGDVPSYVKIHILYGSGSGYQNFSMNVARGTYTSGVACTFSTSFVAGTYYYYITTASTNHTVTYPSTSVLTLVVGSGAPNRTKVAATATFGQGTDGSAPSFNVDTYDSGFTVTFVEGRKGYVEVDIDSESGEDRIFSIVLDRGLFDINKPEDLKVTVDGLQVPYRFVSDPEQMSGDEPFFYVIVGEDGATLYIYLPEASSHVITASTGTDKPADHSIWFVLIAVLVLIVIGAVVALSMLTAAQRKKINVYYEDFDVGLRPDGVVAGRIMDEDDIDWDDLIEQ
ncbi:MAG: hypothetical protein JXA22_01455 [Candidatus Thermoplasmatota archaeon]|nr:hypothetical protein [Candidatus Thermoplasmatota archaeon]